MVRKAGVKGSEYQLLPGTVGLTTVEYMDTGVGSVDAVLVDGDELMLSMSHMSDEICESGGKLRR